MEDNFVALDGLSLPEAFQRFVLQDPTVMPVGQEVIRLEPIIVAFSKKVKRQAILLIIDGH